MHIHTLLCRAALTAMLPFLTLTVSAQGSNDFGYPVAPDTTSSLQAPVGSIGGSLSVSSTGGAAYTMPIEVPKGVSDSEPSLSITYNSQSGNGLVGYGCNLTGLSAITRVPTDIYHDGAATGLNYKQLDGIFSLDGQRLIKTGDVMNGDSLRFQPEFDPFTEVVLHGLSSSTQTDQQSLWFSVRTPDGLYREYGHSNNSRQYYSLGSLYLVNSWCVSSDTNPCGGVRQYSYINWDNFLYIQNVSYGSNVVRFDYEQRTDTIKSSFWTTSVLVTKRLATITTATLVGGNDSIYRQYSLHYINNDQTTTGYSRLDRITVANGNGEELRPTTFNWNTPNAYICQKDTPGFNYNYWGTERSSVSLFSADFNGDGLMDIAQYGRTHQNYGGNNYIQTHYAQINQNGTLSFSQGNVIDLGNDICIAHDDDHLGWNSVKTSPVAFDMDADGLPELLVPEYYFSEDGSHFGFYVCKNNETIGGVKYWDLHTDNVEDVLWTAGDLNNDGIVEFVILEKNSDGSAYYGAIMGGYQQDQPGNTHIAYNKFFRFVLPARPMHVFTADMNCNGLADLVVFYNQGYSVFYNDGSWLDDNLSSPYYPSVTNHSLGVYPNKVWPGDFNGDGITDFLLCPYDSPNFYFEFGDGHGGLTEELACTLSNIYDEPDTDRDDDTFFCQVFDMDGDGKTDAVIHKAMYYDASSWYESSYYKHEKTYVYWMRSNGHQLIQQSMAYTGLKIEEEARFYTLGDFNGDGLQEVAALSFDCYSDQDNNYDVRFRIYRNGSHQPSSGKITSLTNGLNTQTIIDYKTTADTSAYSRLSSSEALSYPVIQVPNPLPIVSKVTSDNGASGQATTNYSYKGLQAHVQGRGMLGMTSTNVQDSITGMLTKSWVKQWHSDAFVPVMTKDTVTIGTHSSYKTTQNIVHSLGSGTSRRFWYNPQNITSIDFDGKQSTEQFTYSNTYGRMSSHTMHVGNHLKYTHYEDYIKKGGRYMPCRVYSLMEHPDDEDGYETITHYAYNNKGLVDTLVNYYETNKEQKTIYTYDAYGNPLSKKISGGGITLTTDTWQYDSSHRFVTKHVENGVTAINYTHDLWGNVLTETDNTRTAYPQTQTYTYDGWGRLKSSVSPFGLRTVYTYGWGTTQGQRWFKVVQGDAQPWQKTWYDAMGREVSSQSIGSLNLPISKTVTYNNKGQISSEKSKQGNIVTTTNYTYDYQGRVHSTSLTDSLGTLNQSVSYAYGRNWKSESRDGRTTKTTYDNWGNPQIIETPEDTVSYTYSSHGKPASVTACGHTVTMQYDITGNQTRLVDPDAGIIIYTYDGLRRLSTQKNARNQTQTYTYDSNGRIKSGPVGGSTSVSYTYGTTTSNKGLLLNESVGGARKTTYQYDNYGRVIREARYSYRQGYRYFYFTYNSLNQLATQTYPNGITVSYQYDAYGNHVCTMKGDTVIWRLESSTGNTMQHQLCNSFHQQTAVNAMGLPTAKSIAFGNTQKHSMTFTYDASKGNLTQRTGMLNVAENFAYDNQERLTGTTAGGDSLSFNYAANGNISSKTGIGNYYYESAKPHAVTSIDNDHWQVPERTQKISYNAMGKVTSIIEEGRDTLNTINYGPDGERWTSTFKENGYQVTTLYLGDYEERIDSAGTESICYLDGGVLAVRHADGTQNIYVTYTDHLGSITRIYDEAGQEKFKASYDAWGYQTVYHNDINFYRGYTGHEMLPEFGLINMNGRLYDPLLGRFLSTDDFVQAPYDSQSFNRYSYCLNNPLKYTDPDGEFFLWTYFTAAFETVTNIINHGFNVSQYDWNKTINSWRIDTGMFKGNVGQIINKWTWGLPNSIIGGEIAQGLNFIGMVDNVTEMEGMLALSGVTSGSRAFTIGHYSFGPDGYEATWKDHLFVHEYGHYIQSQLIGPFYLGTIGLPSILSATHIFGIPHIQRWFEVDASRRGADYFDERYGSGKDGYKTGSPDFFDINSFRTGKNSLYVNPRTNKVNFDINPTSNATWIFMDYFYPITTNAITPTLFLQLIK